MADFNLPEHLTKEKGRIFYDPPFRQGFKIWLTICNRFIRRLPYDHVLFCYLPDDTSKIPRQKRDGYKANPNRIN